MDQELGLKKRLLWNFSTTLTIFLLLTTSAVFAYYLWVDPGKVWTEVSSSEGLVNIVWVFCSYNVLFTNTLDNWESFAKISFRIMAFGAAFITLIFNPILFLIGSIFGLLLLLHYFIKIAQK